LVCENATEVFKAGAKRERELPRVVESSNSRSRLALNSDALSATLTDSDPRSSNLNLLIFLLRVDERFLSFGPRLSCHAMNPRQLSFSFGRADDSHWELEKPLVQLSSFKLSATLGLVWPDLKAGAKREQELPRVDESSNSQPRLALNSYALSATLSAAATKETGKTPPKKWSHEHKQ